MTDRPIVTVVQTGAVQEIDFKDGMTVAQALAAAGVEVGRGSEVKVNGETCTDHDCVLTAGNQVMVVGRIRGA